MESIKLYAKWKASAYAATVSVVRLLAKPSLVITLMKFSLHVEPIKPHLGPKTELNTELETWPRSKY